MGRKQLFVLAIITFLVALSPFVIWLIALSSSPFFDPAQSVNTCQQDELEGKTSQEIADLIDFPLITLSKIPPGLPDEPDVFTLGTDAGCQLRILYGLYTEASLHLDITIYNSNHRGANASWKCNKSPSSDVETVCYRDVDYVGKNYSIMLRSPYSLAETQNLTAFLSIS